MEKPLTILALRAKDAFDAAQGEDPEAIARGIARDVLTQGHNRADTCDAPAWTDYQQYVPGLYAVMGEAAFADCLERLRVANGHTWCGQCKQYIDVGYFEFNAQAIGANCDCGGAMAVFIKDMVIDYLTAEQLTGQRVRRLPVGCHA